MPEDATRLLAVSAWSGLAAFTWTLGRRAVRPHSGPRPGDLALYRSVAEAGARGGRVGQGEREMLDAVAISLGVAAADAAGIEREMLAAART